MKRFFSKIFRRRQLPPEWEDCYREMRTLRCPDHLLDKLETTEKLNEGRIRFFRPILVGAALCGLVLLVAPVFRIGPDLPGDQVLNVSNEPRITIDGESYTYSEILEADKQVKNALGTVQSVAFKAAGNRNFKIISETNAWIKQTMQQLCWTFQRKEII